MLSFLVFLFALPFSSTHLLFFLVPAFVFPFENCVVRAAATSFRLDCNSGLLPIPLDPKREREQNLESKRARKAGRQRERERKQERKRERAHASNFLCLRTVPEMIWVSFESKLTYALDRNRSMQSANAPHQQGPCRNQEQRKTQSQRGNQWKSHKTNKESWQSKTKLSGVRYKQI